MGFVILAFLTAASGVAALAVAVRSRPAGRAELVIVTALVWHALTTLPAFGLGLLGQLTALKLGVAVFLLSAATVAATFRGRPARAHVADCRAALAGVVRLPWDVVREGWRDRGFILVGALFAMALIVYTAVLSWFAPAWRGFDALWYHEPITAFAIQNHGFSPIRVDDYGMSKIDGYPRICEMLQLWFVIFTDRRLIDLASCLIAPFFLASAYALVRRFERDRARSLGWAVAVFLMPCVVWQLQCTYIDVHAAAFLVAASHYAARERLRLRDTLLAGLSLTLAVGAKHMALAAGGILTLIILGRALRGHLRTRARAAILTVLAAAAMILSMLAAIYLRNLILFHNPFWPELAYDNPRLGIHWAGKFQAGIGSPEAETNRLYMQLPLAQQLRDLFSIPYSWKRGFYTQVFEYGFGVMWLVIPIGFLCHAAGLLHALASRLARDSRHLVLLGLVLAAAVVTSPALWGPRYNILPVALLAAAIAWVGARPGFARWGTAMPSVAVFCGLVMFVWAPRWLILPRELARLARHPYPDRELMATGEFAPDLASANGSPIVHKTGTARDAELTAGTVIAFGVGGFAALMWNNEYDNRAVYVPDGPDFVARAEAVGPTWIHVGNHTDSYKQMKASPRWEEVGFTNVQHWATAFRRRSR